MPGPEEGNLGISTSMGILGVIARIRLAQASGLVVRGRFWARDLLDLDETGSRWAALKAVMIRDDRAVFGFGITVSLKMIPRVLVLCYFRTIEELLKKDTKGIYSIGLTTVNEWSLLVAYKPSAKAGPVKQSSGYRSPSTSKAPMQQLQQEISIHHSYF
jgi:hypothetical protein